MDAPVLLNAVHILFSNSNLYISRQIVMKQCNIAVPFNDMFNWTNKTQLVPHEHTKHHYGTTTNLHGALLINEVYDFIGSTPHLKLPKTNGIVNLSDHTIHCQSSRVQLVMT